MFQRQFLRFFFFSCLVSFFSCFGTDIDQSMLTLVRVMPASLSAFEKQDRHLFPGDTEADFVLALKRSEVALAKILNCGTPALLAAIRDQQRVKTSDLEDSNTTAVQPAKQNQVCCFCKWGFSVL